MQNNSRGRIITFYSYKGGVGRSMTLINLAWVMASSGLRVLVVDWDLEAPGLHRYLRPFLPDPDLTSTSGLLELLTNYTLEAMTPTENPAPDWYLACADVRKYASEVEWPFPTSGRLELLGTGKQGSTYAERVSSFDWSGFYDRFSGGMFLEAVKDRMRADYDYILIDSRTGLSDIAGICTVQMPDDLVLCVALNNRSLEGAAAVASAVAQQRKPPLEPLRIFPVPVRVEVVEFELRQRALETTENLFSSLMDHIEDKRVYLRDVSVPYVPYFSFNEIPGAFAEGYASDQVLQPIERLAAYLTDGKVDCHIEVPEAERASVRERYKGASA